MNTKCIHRVTYNSPDCLQLIDALLIMRIFNANKIQNFCLQLCKEYSKCILVLKTAQMYFTMFENHSKLSHFNFWFWHFLQIFVLLKVTCLVTLFDRKLQVFKNSSKLTIFGIFNELLSTQNVNIHSTLRSHETFSEIFKHRDSVKKYLQNDFF